MTRAFSLRLTLLVFMMGIAIALLVTRTDGLWLNGRAADGSRLGLVLLPVLIIGLAVRFKYDLASPAVLFAFFWSLSLAVAQLPFYQDTTWTSSTWAVVSVPPLLLTIGAMITTGGSALNRQPIPIRLESPHADRLAGILLPLMIVGSLITIYTFKILGAVPLLSSQIDSTRFSEAVHPFIELATRPVPICMILAATAIALGKHRRPMFIGITIAAGLLLLGLAGRLHVVAPAAVILLTIYIARGIRARTIALGVIAVTGLLLLSSVVFIQRAAQHREFEFESYLFDVVESRQGVLAALTPTQIGLSSSLHTFARLVETEALQRNNQPGLYSLHGFDRYFAARDSEEVGRRVVGALLTGTYLADIYGDWGILGASIWSFLCGLAYGLVYKTAVRRRHPDIIFIYAYISFWLIFFIYVNIWTHYIFWSVDMLLLWLITRKVWGVGSREEATEDSLATA